MTEVKTAKNAKNTNIISHNYIQMIALGGLLIAIEIILERVLVIEPTGTNRYSLAFVPRAISGYLFGPFWTMAICFISDFVGATIKFGAPNIFLSITAVLKGLIYGLFFHKKKFTIPRVVGAALSVELGCGLLVNSYILYRLYIHNTSFKLYLLGRVAQAAIMTGLEIVVLFVLGRVLMPQLSRLVSQMMNSNKSLEKVNKVISPGSKLGLSRVKEFAELLGSPEQQLRIIHVVGTNGKGSTSNMLADVLIAQGYKVGLFNSPYLSTPIEYFNINHELIPASEFKAYTDELTTLISAHLGNELAEAPTEFEFYTCAALKYFANEKCDFVVLEAGMGGETDATNFIPAPELCLVTNIGIDHEAWLGDTLCKIAEQKAGVIKKGCAAAIYPSEEEVKEVFVKKCMANNVKYAIADFDRLSSYGVYGASMSTVISYTSSKGKAYELVVNTPALYQAKNAALVLEGIELLQDRGIIISDESIKKGFEAFNMPARFEVFSTSPLIIADGGHNPQCVENALESLRLLAENKKVYVLTGVMRDKDYSKMYDLINELADEYIVTAPNMERALPPEELRKFLEKYNKRITIAASPKEGVKIAKEMLSADDCLYITGTLYMMDEVRKSLL